VEVKRPAQAERGGSRPYFGSIPDFGGDGPGYGISGAAPGSPADKGGLKAGDRIVQLGTQKITDLNDFDLALRKFSAGDEIEVVVLRNKEHVTLKVVLEKPK
jgi:S1-C subfamily serine protease